MKEGIPHFRIYWHVNGKAVIYPINQEARDFILNNDVTLSEIMEVSMRILNNY